MTSGLTLENRPHPAQSQINSDDKDGKQLFRA